MQSPPSDEQAFRALITLAILIAKAGNISEGDKQAIKVLGQAADRKDQEGVAS